MSSNLQKLTELAEEQSSDKRRELLRQVTDLFFANKENCSSNENEHFGEILSHVTAEMDTEVRKEMAVRFQKEKETPLKLLHKLANDEIDISGPVLKNSPALDDEQLCKVISNGNQPHMQAISRRENISESVTRNLVSEGSDQTLVVLAGNQGARFDRNSMQTMVSRSEAVPELQKPLVEHRDLPADLMNEMYDFAEKKVRERILQRNEDIGEEELTKALKQARNRSTRTPVDRPEGYREARIAATALHQKGQLTGPSLIKFERDGERLKFTHALALMCNIDFDTVHAMMERNDIDALALLCRALEFDLSLFITLAVLTDRTGAFDMSKTQDLGDIYEIIPIEAAQRTLRFWQMRQKVENSQAA